MPLTGTTLLPDIGSLKYGTALGTADFTCLYRSIMSGKATKDASGRTVKFMEYTLSVDATVTLQGKNTTIDGQMTSLRRILDAQAGQLTFTGKGFGTLVVNPQGGVGQGGVFDVNWGPKPETIEFIPLGGSRSANVKWVVTFCIPEIDSPVRVRSGIENRPVLQFNFDTSLTYGDDFYSGIRYKGTLEIPLTREIQNKRTLSSTVDDFRTRFMAQIVTPDLLTRFRVKTRSFDVSRDKRTLEFTVELEEITPTGLPAGIESAEGEYTIRPLKESKTLQGTVRWICTLSMTYTIPNNVPKRLTWIMFANMWVFRMAQSRLADVPGIPGLVQINNNVAVNSYIGAGYQRNIEQFLAANNIVPGGTSNPLPAGNRIPDTIPGAIAQSKVAIPTSLVVREGLCLNSKTVTYEATWQLTTRLKRLLLAAGLFRPTGLEGGNLWAASVASISGGKSWLENRLDPAGEVIVDFGS